jgi:AraC-like DNA-binding protein
MSLTAKTCLFEHNEKLLRTCADDGRFSSSRLLSMAMTVHKDRFRRPQQAGAGVRLRPVFDDFHLLRMEGRYEYPRHQHTNYEVILVECGPYRCELNATELVLARGQVLVIKPGDWHQDHLRHGQRHYVLHFRILGAEAGKRGIALFRAGVAAHEQVCGGDYSSEAWVLDQLRREALAGGPYAGAVQDSLLEALFWRLLRGLNPLAVSQELRQLPVLETRREEIAGVLASFIDRNPDVRELAAALHLSPRHLTNRCRELFGESPARLLLQLKMRRADELLEHSAMRVSEVSDTLGFVNPFHFSRVFRRFHGIPPSLRPRPEVADPARSRGR